MNKLFFFSFGLIFVFASIYFYRWQNSSEMIFNKVISQTTKKLEKKYKMVAVGIGGSEKDGKVTSIVRSFSRYKGPITKKKGREMIICSVEAYIKAINESEQAKPYLNNFPFTNENIDVVIINYQENGQSLKDPNIKIFANYANKIHFKTEDPLNSYNYKTNESEPYLKALEIVKKTIY